MSRKIDLTGRRYGRLVVLEDTGIRKNKSIVWKCECDCGKIVFPTARHLSIGNTTSCGCSRIKHGYAGTRIFSIWRGMKERCDNKNSRSYKNYGGRGISICDEWYDIDTFYSWAMSSGYADDLTLDRIDVNGNYEPDNCKWSTDIEQHNNRNDNIYYERDGKNQSIAMWCRELGIKKGTVYRRIQRGWDIWDALTREKRNYPEVIKNEK